MSASLSPVTPNRGGLAALSLASLLAALGTSIANVGLPALSQGLAAPLAAVQWVVIAYLLAVTALVAGAGRLGDLVGRRRLLLGGITVYAAASALCGVAPALWLLVVARAAQGAGAAVMMALTVAMIAEAVPKERAGSAMGLLGTMSAVGTALGPSLGGVLIAAFGWRAIFLAGLPLGLVAMVLAWRGLPADRPTAERPAFDRLGTAVLAGTLAAYALAMTLGQGGFGLPSLALLAVALAGAGLFAVVERRAAAPLVRLAALREPQLGAGLAANAVVAAVMMATLVVGPFYLFRGLGLDAALVGAVMSAGPVASALAGVPAGRLVDRVGARGATLAGLAGIAAGAAGLALLPPAWGIPAYVLPILVMTPGYALFQAANNTAVMQDVPPDRRGGVSGLLNLSRNLGLITGASLMGTIFAVAAGAADMAAADPAAVARGMRITFAAGALAVATALVFIAGSRGFAGFRARF